MKTRIIIVPLIMFLFIDVGVIAKGLADYYKDSPPEGGPACCCTIWGTSESEVCKDSCESIDEEWIDCDEGVCPYPVGTGKTNLVFDSSYPGLCLPGDQEPTCCTWRDPDNGIPYCSYRECPPLQV